jgi:hypothetical protein
MKGAAGISYWFDASVTFASSQMILPIRWIWGGGVPEILTPKRTSFVCWHYVSSPEAKNLFMYTPIGVILRPSLTYDTQISVYYPVLKFTKAYMKGCVLVTSKGMRCLSLITDLKLIMYCTWSVLTQMISDYLVIFWQTGRFPNRHAKWGVVTTDPAPTRRLFLVKLSSIKSDA